MIFIPKADGSIIIDTKIDSTGLSKGTQNIKSQLEGLAGTVGKLGIAIAAAFSVKEIIAFGKEAIKLGSDLQEVQNVVDVTFTTMNEQVNEFAKNAAKAAGLSETMAKRYVGTFGAMAKSFRFTEEEAYNMSTSLTQLAGDVASFYNLTQDEAYTKLKSVFTGETESLKDLGVVMTQTALDDFALRKGLGKTTDQMSEQEKVALRYEFVLEQLSGASGDFLRTSDSWANQTRLLTLQFDQLKATIGQGLINVLTPAVQMLNELIEKLQASAEAFKSFTAAVFGDASGGAETAFESTAESAGELEQNIKRSVKEAKKLINGFDELNIIADESTKDDLTDIVVPESAKPEVGDNAPAEIPQWMTALAEGIQKLIEPLQKIDFNPLKEQVSGLVLEFTKLASTIGDSLQWVWYNVLVPMSEWAMEEVAPESVNTFSLALSTLSSVVDGLQPLGIWLWEDFLQPIAEWTGEKAVEGLDNLRTALLGISSSIKENEKAVNSLAIILGSIAGSVGAVSIAAKIAQYVAAVSAMAPEVGLLAAMFPKLSGAIATLGAWITGTLVPAITGGLTAIAAALGISVGWLVAIIAAVAAAVAAVIIYWDEISAFFSKLWANISAWAARAWEDISAFASRAWGGISAAASDCWNAIVEFFSPAVEWFSELFGSIWNTLSDIFYNIGVIASGCWEIIKAVWGIVSTWFDKNVCQPIESFFTSIWDGVKKGAKAAWEGVKEAFSSVATFFGDIFKKAWGKVVNVFSPLGEIFTNIKEGILQVFKSVVNGLIKGLNSIIKVPFDGINKALSAIKGITIAGIKPFGNLSTINVPQIPYLAQGAVIPPRAPFLAMLGDQRNGTNIEAPLSTIQDAVAQVMEGQTERTVAALYALLSVAERIEQKDLNVQIGDDDIGLAHARYTKSRGVQVNSGAFADAY